MKSFFHKLLVFGGLASAWASPQNPDVAAHLSVLDIEPVWAGHPVGFSLVTRGDRQFAAYFDADRRLSVAQRKLGESRWQITKLDVFLKWDSHHNVAMALDREGYLHVSGRMHASPLIYFRSTKPLDASSLARVPAMTGNRENSCTYPRFFKDPGGALAFSHRDGPSGKGDTLYKVYDEKTRTWSGLVETSFLDGEQKGNAYPQLPEAGPDGYYHLAWVWRETPAAETCHDLSYVRSKNLRDWETAGGQPVDLPITVHTPGTVVDPVPSGGGLLNGSCQVGFDRENRAVIAYQKFDDAGKTQLYFARFENEEWKKYQATDWTYRWDFHGRGSLPREIWHGRLKPRNGELTVDIEHKVHGSGTWTVNDHTLRLEKKIPSPDKEPAPELQQVHSNFPGMQVRWALDTGGNRGDEVNYRLRWETLGPNRDKPRKQPWPEPVMLQVVVLP